MLFFKIKLKDTKINYKKMISKEAQKSIKRFKRASSFIGLLYKSPKEMTSGRMKIGRWFNNLQGTVFPKVKGTTKEVIYLDDIRSFKISTPNSDPERILLYFHGGGYSLGSPESHYALASYLADITKTVVYVPDYRLGPENKFPAQLEDGVKSYKFLIDNLGYAPEQVAISGDSAGGHLALITLLKLKEDGVQLPSALALLSPWTDPSASGDTYTYEMADRDIMLGPLFKKIWENGDQPYDYFLNQEDYDENDKYVVPLKGDYENCPPIMIQVGTEELLLSDSQRLRDVLKEDNCEHEYYEWENMYHVFHVDVRMPETIEAFNQIGNFLRKHIGIKL